MPLAWVSCAGSRFLETNHEFVQSNECEGLARDLQLLRRPGRARLNRVPVRPQNARLPSVHRRVLGLGPSACSWSAGATGLLRSGWALAW